MTTIYLSSTYEDLKDYRQVVFDALRRAGHRVFAMEDYVAADQRPVAQCLKDVEDADIYVGLFAFRYGYVPPENHGNPNKLSITELEFRHAEALKKPCLTFFVDEKTPWPNVFSDAYHADDKGKRIKTLRQHLLSEKLASSFSAPHELSTLVLAAVAKHLNVGKSSEPTHPTEAAEAATVFWDIEKQGSPYPGLLHFTRKYAPVFFGRDAEVREILDRLREPEGRFMIISGDSGVGKSSVVDAGLLPILEHGGLPDVEPCLSVRMVPSQRRQPVEALLGALGSLVTQAGLRPDSLLEELTRAPDTLGAQITATMKQSAASRSLVLFIDQMEELFTSQDLNQANRFLAALYQAAQEGPLWVIGTIRSDHLHYCHRHPDMLKVLNSNGHYALGPVQPYMMQDMILKPAQAVGLTMTETFAKRLIHDTEAASANLPLLAFVLEQLFQKRTNHELSEKVYEELGGISGAIATHVKAVEDKIQKTVGVKAAEVLPALFQALVNVQKEEGIPTRNRQKKHEFPDHLQPVINQLVTERLFRTEGEGEDATVSISHEKLFDAWPALKEYVGTKNKELVDRTLLDSRAKKWVRIGKPPFSGLATGREYHDFLKAGFAGNALTREFLQASRRARHLWMGSILVIILLLSGLTYLWQKGYNMEQALLKVRSLVVRINVPPEMVSIPDGKFRQGDEFAFIPEVTMRAFAMGKHEVTFEEYDRFAIATNRELPNDQGWGRGQRPVINVTWQDAKDYATWLSVQIGQPYRLPTESEWEYAARSGNKQEKWAGTDDETRLGDYAVYAANSGYRTAVVGSKQDNSFNLKDMSGNVFEWVEDCWHENYQGAPGDGTVWEEAGGDYCTLHTIRGGSWHNSPRSLRASSREGYTIDFRNFNLGFRLVQETP